MPTHDYPYKNLVFEDGGVKGVAYGGVLEALEQNKITPQIEPTLIGGGNFRRSSRSGRQHKVFHPIRAVRLGTPVWVLLLR